METKKSNEEHIIQVGDKPFMNYITGVVLHFTTKGADSVRIVARGKFISKAVDIAEIARRKFLESQNLEVGKIEIGSESFENKEGKKVNVSFIEIELKK
ncbi:MAG: DNA-binding protein [Patescibacteria group bacterium]|jgi:DNA-binding protein